LFITTHNQETEDQQSGYNTEEQKFDPFFYYEEDHVQECIKKCTNSLIGKFLSEKPLSTQTIHNTLTGFGVTLWG